MQNLKQYIKQNSALVVGLGLPVVMVVVIALAIWIPTLTNHPKTNFVFATGSGFGSSALYSVHDNKLVKTDQPPLSTDPKSYSPTYPEQKLYTYNVTDKKATSVTFDDAAKLKLSDAAESPDGYTVISNGYSGGVFPLMFEGPSAYDTRYIQGHHLSQKLNLPTDVNQPYYSTGRFQFLGWIVE